jgi:hypothetical protein
VGEQNGTGQIFLLVLLFLTAVSNNDPFYPLFMRGLYCTNVRSCEGPSKVRKDIFSFDVCSNVRMKMSMHTVYSLSFYDLGILT